jgi:hypothetical protein
MLSLFALIHPHQLALGQNVSFHCLEQILIHHTRLKAEHRVGRGEFEVSSMSSGAHLAHQGHTTHWLLATMGLLVMPQRTDCCSWVSNESVITQYVKTESTSHSTTLTTTANIAATDDTIRQLTLLPVRVEP